MTNRFENNKIIHYNIRQKHILDYKNIYWTEVRIQQIIGRGIRHCNSPSAQSSQPEKLNPDDTIRISTDEYIEDQAKTKANLIESFLSAMKEAAVNCELFRATICYHKRTNVSNFQRIQLLDRM